MRKRQFTIIGVLIFILISCKQDSKPLPLDYLPGYWDVYSAERNGKKTSLLNGAFFEFKAGDVIVTNVNGDTASTNYILANNTIKVKDLNKDFRIESLSQDSMTLYSEISNYSYNFYTVRSNKR